MIVNRPIAEERLKFKKVMVCIDFSESCEFALQFAKKVAQNHGSKLFMFHMLPVSPSPKYPQAEFEAELSTSEKMLEEFSKEIPKSIEREHGVWGGDSPYLEILKYAREKDVDLITMGSHTKEKGEKWYVGSAVEQVSSRSMCLVAVVTDLKVLLSVED